MATMIQTLSEQATAKYAEYKGLIDGELTQESVLQAEGLLAELKTLRDRIDETRSVDAKGTDLKKFGSDYESFLRTPVSPAPFGGDGGPETGVKIIGSKRDGQTHVDREEKAWYLTDEGDFLMTEHQIKAISEPGYKEAFRQYCRFGIQKLSSPQLKFLQEGEDTLGGYLVPEEQMSRLIQKEPAPTRVAGRVTSLTISRDRVSVPKVNYTTDDVYTTGIRVTSTGENPNSSTVHRTADPVFGRVTIPVHTYMMSLPITNDMLEDSVFPLQAWITGKFSETIDLHRDNMIINGNGIENPAGILMNPDTGTPAPQTGTGAQPKVFGSLDANTVTADGLVSIAFEIPEQYDSNVTWVFNKRSTAKAVALLKDGELRYIWNMGAVQTNLSNTSSQAHPLVGYPVIYSAFMPNIAPNAFPIVLGDLSGYYLVNRVGFSVQVLRELYAETNQIVILGRMRFGGQIAEEFKMKIMQIRATA